MGFFFVVDMKSVELPVLEGLENVVSVRLFLISFCFYESIHDLVLCNLTIVLCKCFQKQRSSKPYADVEDNG